MSSITPAEYNDYQTAMATQQIMAAMDTIDRRIQRVRDALAVGDAEQVSVAIRDLTAIAGSCMHGLSHAAGALDMLKDGRAEYA